MPSKILRIEVLIFVANAFFLMRCAFYLFFNLSKDIQIVTRIRSMANANRPISSLDLSLVWMPSSPKLIRSAKSARDMILFDKLLRQSHMAFL